MAYRGTQTEGPNPEGGARKIGKKKVIFRKRAPGVRVKRKETLRLTAAICPCF